MENYCRGCLKSDDPGEFLQYTEKNRRLFVYSTGLQVKRNDNFIFQLCKDCVHAMKVACTFKKTCRNSDKKLKSYFECKEAGDTADFCSYLKNNDEMLKFRLPLAIGNSTPVNYKKDDDNESTCTSIQNFMTDILQADEIPDNEARIIREVIEEEADVLEDSLDSHWLQDDVSVDTEFKLDYSFSPFSTSHFGNNDQYVSPKNEINEKVIEDKERIESGKKEFESDKENLNYVKKDHETEKKCRIDINLEHALKKEGAEKVYLHELLATPPVIPDISAPSTPLITNILFGDRIEESNYESNEDIDVLDEFLNGNKDKSIDTDLFSNLDNLSINKSIKILDIQPVKQANSPLETKYCIKNFYCKMCNRKFKNLHALKIHFTKHHKMKVVHEKAKRERKQMICDYCGKMFSSSNQITKHITQHMNPKEYVCMRCTLRFSSERCLKSHMSTHTGILPPKNLSKNYVCNLCGKMYTTSSNYHIHMRRHNNDYTMSCQKCGKGFYRSTDLEIHMRCHTGEKPYECRFCPQRFSRSDVLNRHMKCHTDEKPHLCNFCDKKFAKAYDLKKHQNNAKSCIKQQLDIALK